MSAERYRDAYGARMAVADALGWLHDDDGWTWDDLREMCNEEIDRMVEDAEDAEAATP